MAYVYQHEDFADIVYGEKCPAIHAARKIQSMAYRISFQLSGQRCISEDILLKERKAKIPEYDLPRITRMVEAHAEETFKKKFLRKLMPIVESPRRTRLQTVKDLNSSFITSVMVSPKASAKKPKFVVSSRNNFLNRSVVDRTSFPDNRQQYLIKSINVLADPQTPNQASPSHNTVRLDTLLMSNIGPSPNKSFSVVRVPESPLGKTCRSIGKRDVAAKRDASQAEVKVSAFLLNLSFEKSKINDRSRKSLQESVQGDSRKDPLKSYLTRMFLNDNPAVIQKRKIESKQKRNKSMTAMKTLLGKSGSRVKIDMKCKSRVASADISQEFIDSAALASVPTRVYLEKDNLKHLSGDTLSFMVKKSCQDSKFESLGSASKKISLLKDISHHDQNSIRFIKKNLRNRQHSSMVRKEYDLVNDDHHAIQIDENLKRVLGEEEKAKNLKKVQTERAALDAVVVKKVEKVEPLTPAKRLQEMIYFHRYVGCNDRRN